MAQNRRLSAALTLTLTVGLACGFAPAAIAANPGEISGTVFADLDASTSRDAGENGLADVTVTVTDALGAVVGTPVLTDADGDYTIAVPAGTYTVRFTEPSNSDLVATDGAGSHPYPAPVTVTATAGVDMEPVGFTAGAVVNGSVFDDLNGDNIQQPAEVALGFDTVQALDPNTGDVLDEVHAESDGTYSFTLLPGSYVIKAFHAGFAVKGIPFTFTAGTKDGVEIGLTRLPGTISGVVWDDVNRNGVRDQGEAGVAGAEVAAGLTDGTLAGTKLGKAVVTDADGKYTLTLPAWGKYGVAVSPPTGYVTTASGTQNFQVVDLTNTKRTGTYDVGVVKDLSMLAGYVWDDVDGDGKDNDGDLPIAGAKVTVKEAGSGKVVATPDLAEDGSFAVDLPDGTYLVEFTAPSGYFTHAGAESAGASKTVTLSPSDPIGMVSSGMVKAAGIDGSAWIDANGDQKRGADEKPLEGATFTIKLQGPDGKEITTKSDAKGLFVFNDLMPGKYDVTMKAPDGYPNLVQDTVSGTIVLAPGERLALPAWIRPASVTNPGTGTGGGTTGGTGTGSGTTSPTTGTQGKATPALAKTGSDVTTPLVTASGLIAAGFALIARRRRSI